MDRPVTSGDWPSTLHFVLSPPPYFYFLLQSTNPPCSQWLAASSKWTYHILTLNKSTLPAFPSPLNSPLPLILPFTPTQPLQTLPALFDQPHALGQPSRKWPKTTKFQIRQRQPPQNPLPVNLAPTTILILLNALVTPKARASLKKQQKSSPPLVPARSTYNLTDSASLLAHTEQFFPNQRPPYDLSHHFFLSHYQRTHPRH